MKKLIMSVLICSSFLLTAATSLIAGGALVKLKRIADGMSLQDKVLEQEAENYKRAEALINSREIEKGLTHSFILERCGEPVARVRDDREWVYKPPTSTFFKGEKIYFVFGEENKLIDWKKVSQE